MFGVLFALHPEKAADNWLAAALLQVFDARLELRQHCEVEHALVGILSPFARVEVATARLWFTAHPLAAVPTVMQRHAAGDGT